MAERKTPMRKCLGCGEMFPQRELVRVVKTKIKPEAEDGEVTYEVSLDLVGKKNGRGAYVCRKSECFEKARKAKRFARALQCEISEDIYEKMAGEMRDSE
ncbi:MAG: YlxR family protein [Clostridia bacterium]|nr:YlxR family protein [Clostridia bacterium]